MYIKKIIIKELFGHTETFEWSLNDSVNILGGMNGSGKSTIVKTCFQMLRYGRLVTPALANRFTSVEIQMSNGFVLKCNKRNLLKYKLEDNSIVPELDENGVQVTTMSPHVIVFDQNGEKKDYRDLNVANSVYFLSPFEQNISDAIRMSKLRQEDEDTPETYIDALIQEQLNVRNSNFAGIMERLLASVNNDVVARAFKEDASVKQYMQLYIAIQSFLDGYGVHLNNKLSFDRNGNNIKYSDMSMGEKELLLILLTVSNTNVAPCIVFLDEPDLSMHVDWKKKLIKVLHNLNPNMQLILTTHAPSMVRGWYDNVFNMNDLMKS